MTEGTIEKSALRLWLLACSPAFSRQLSTLSKVIKERVLPVIKMSSHNDIGNALQNAFHDWSGGNSTGQYL